MHMVEEQEKKKIYPFLTINSALQSDPSGGLTKQSCGARTLQVSGENAGLSIEEWRVGLCLLPTSSPAGSPGHSVSPQSLSR